MKKLKNILIPSTTKPTLVDVCFVEDKKQKPVVVFCHGFKGYKNWGAWDLVAKRFAENGFVFVKFNLSHNGGTIENPIDFPDLDSFGHNTYSKELFDLNAVIDWFYSSVFPVDNNEIDLSNIHLIGHSRGGGVSLLQAARDSRISNIATWASVATLERFGTREEVAEWKQKGVKYIMNGRTKQKMPMYLDIYNDYYENKTVLDIQMGCEKLEKPLLVVHGKNDTAVGYSHALRISQWAKNAELFTLENANHVFGAKHPWDDKHLPSDLAKVTDKTIHFFKTA